MTIKLPKEINYVEAYLTFRCNLNCPYCVNDFDGIKRKQKELAGTDWLFGLNRIDFGNVPLTLGGGEPTMHKDFYKIVQGLKPKIDLLTNLTFDVNRFVEEVNPEKFYQSDNPAYKSIRVSYHPKRMDAEKLVDKVRILQDSDYDIGIFGLNYPENKKANIQMSEIARKERVYFFIKDFLGRYKGKMFGYYKYPSALKETKGNHACMCKTKELLIGPDGAVYKCHRDLYKTENPVNNIVSGIPESKFRQCFHFGECHPCDIRIKANRFLDMGECSVEIRK